MITKLQDDYMVTGMLYRKININQASPSPQKGQNQKQNDNVTSSAYTTNDNLNSPKKDDTNTLNAQTPIIGSPKKERDLDLKMIYFELNIETMIIGYKNHHLDLAYTKQYDFKQVSSCEKIDPYDKLKIKQGFKITFSDYNDSLILYTMSSREYEIWLTALKDYIKKKLVWEKEIAKEEKKEKIKLKLSSGKLNRRGSIDQHENGTGRESNWSCEFESEEGNRNDSNKIDDVSIENDDDKQKTMDKWRNSN